MTGSPELMWPTRMLIYVVRGYRLLFGPWLGTSCRFSPTCSAYSLQALEAFGAAAGTYLTLRRLSRCHPWCEGGEDPVPKHLPRPFAWWLSSPSSATPNDRERAP